MILDDIENGEIFEELHLGEVNDPEIIHWGIAG